jgi:hypothetical protein
MTFPRALALTLAFAFAPVVEAVAQFPPPPGQAAPAQSSPFPPPPGHQAPAQASPFPTPGQPAPVQAQPSPFPAPGQVPTTRPATPFPSAGPPSSPFQPPGSARNVCEQFTPIREQAEKSGLAIKAAGERKATREEMCELFKKFAVAEGRMTKFLETHQAACGVPPQAIKQVKAQHAKTLDVRQKICSAAPPAARGPSLSDALGGPILPDAAPKPGRGTFDTLTGSPLAR